MVVYSSIKKVVSVNIHRHDALDEGSIPINVHENVRLVGSVTASLAPGSDADERSLVHQRAAVQILRNNVIVSSHAHNGGVYNKTVCTYQTQSSAHGGVPADLVVVLPQVLLLEPLGALVVRQQVHVDARHGVGGRVPDAHPGLVDRVGEILGGKLDRLLEPRVPYLGRKLGKKRKRLQGIFRG